MKLSFVMQSALQAAREGPLVPLKGGFWVRIKHQDAKYEERRGLVLPDGTPLVAMADLTPGNVGVYPDTALAYWATGTMRALVNRSLLGPEDHIKLYPYRTLTITAAGLKVMEASK